MLRINNIRLSLNEGEKALLRKAAAILRVSPNAIKELQLVKRSIDARKKNDLHLVCCVNVAVDEEEQVAARANSRDVTILRALPYHFPKPDNIPLTPPVVVGMGPAGLFAALSLARAGIPVTVLERGQDVDRRTEAVEAFWSTGRLDPHSNVQFGEGGAGTFSDGKLTTGTHDPRIGMVLETLVRFGAPEDVTYSHKPHIGTDILRNVVKNIRLELIRLGCTVLFEHKLTGISQRAGHLTAITVSSPTGEKIIPCDRLILAPGHSARDTFSMLLEAGLPMEQKNFAIGVRIEHAQEAVSRAQFGEVWETLPAADYKLSCHLPSGRSAFTFCVCPGGQVVASASEEGHLVTNGMSCRSRDGKNINGGFLVGVGPADFPGEDPLAGVRFQEQWERAAYLAGGSNFRAPAQLVGDFLSRLPSTGPGSVVPTYRPGVTWGDLRDCLPDYVTDTLRDALPIFDRRVKGFAFPEAVLTGVETRSSSPVRILRDESGQSTLRGIFPCGEGCGYAGGITSAAVDGVRMAEALAKSL